MRLNAGASPLGPLSGTGCTFRPGENYCPRGQSIDGNILPSSPKNKIALNGLYTWNMEDGSKIDTSLSYFWQDISYSFDLQPDLHEGSGVGSVGWPRQLDQQR